MSGEPPTRFLPAEWERTRFSCSSLWNNKTAHDGQAGTRETSDFSNSGVTLLQLADRNNRPGKFAKTGRNSIDNWKE